MQKCFSKWVLLKNSGNSQKTPELEFHLDKFGGREYKLDKRSGWRTKAALASALVGYELYSSGSLQGKPSVNLPHLRFPWVLKDLNNVKFAEMLCLIQCSSGSFYQKRFLRKTGTL